MFRNRRTQRKPDQGLINKFKESFRDIVPSTTAKRDAEPIEHVGESTTGPDMTNGEMNLDDSMPKAMQDFRITPFLDPNALTYLPSGSQPNGYYTPNSGQMGSAFHEQPADLHPSNVDLNLMTPLALPNQLVNTRVGADNAGLDFSHFNQQYLPSQYHAPNPFAQQPSFAPSAFVNSDSGFNSIEDADQPTVKELDMHENPSWSMEPPASAFDQMDFSEAEPTKFRFNSTLRAPTAMIKHPKEIPVTYLNKGQAYSLSVVDSNPPQIPAQPIKYRTYVHVSFEEEEQRSKPAACWQLWKEGRGLNEAHQRGGKLQAVEYVDPMHGTSEDRKHHQVQLVSASFDGFCVTWTPNPSTGALDCSIPVRFNFLSTDFSHSKGVKGIPVRLCAKTEVISPEGTDGNAEVCYCKVKLFRDHGAERKLSNDVAHVKKTIEKLKQQITQAEVGGGNFGKRKRSAGSIAMKDADDRPTKLMKQKRRWSIDSQNSQPGRITLEDDLHSKLETMQDMFTSTRPVSVLNLPGDEQDDPDLYPVQLPGETKKSLKVETNGEIFTNGNGTSETSGQSPMSSVISMVSPHHPVRSKLSYDSGYPGSIEGSREHSRPGSEGALDKLIQRSPIKITRVNTDPAGPPGEFIEALDVDTTYRPSSSNIPRPVACFYVRYPQTDTHRDDYYRAIYLTERTAKDLAEKILHKQQIDTSRVTRLLHIKQQNGLKVVVDDDVVTQLPDGQDMVADFCEVPNAENPNAIEVTLTF